MDGGLLGVDVFFVLSGFLITALLCDESVRTDTIALASFWGRRARRLLPALFVMLIGVALYAYFDASSLDLPSIRGDAMSTLSYVANWRFILSDQGYFTLAAAPSPLLHTWSLAVEEQYYLMWPLVALGVLRWKGTRALAVVAGVGALSSASLMAGMHHAGFSIDRLYYGTDTRVQALMVGSCLGAIASRGSWRVFPETWSMTSVGRRTGAVLGAMGAGFLLWAWHAYNGQNSFLYDGGFLLVALAAAAVIAQVVSWPRSWLARFCSLGAVGFIGRISYGLYLYHWPLFLALDHAHTGLGGFELLAVRLVATLVVSTASYYLVELPIRTHGVFRGWRPLAASGAAVMVTVTSLVVTTAPSAATAIAAGAPVMSLNLRKQLTGDKAFSTNPVRFLLFGDSVALTLGVGLSHDSEQNFGVKEYNGGIVGCDLDPNLMVRNSGQVTIAPSGCTDWPQLLAHAVGSIRPQVAAVLLGRWEGCDHFYQGQWTHVGEPLWDNHLLDELNQTIDILSSGGAKVVLFTEPDMAPSNEAADGSVFPEDQPSRVAAYDALVDKIGKTRPGVVTVIDLNHDLSPDGHFTATVGDVRVRSSDGIHISAAGGQWLQPKILSTLAELGLSARLVPPARASGRESAPGHQPLSTHS